jgi:hypothetical protein
MGFLGVIREKNDGCSGIDKRRTVVYLYWLHAGDP